MRFVYLGPGGLVRRVEIADTLTAFAPDSEPKHDFQRGYVAALMRIATAYGIEIVATDSRAVVEVSQ